ncbi:MAG: AFG1 family ATPase [Betaproteobacteria bacterium]|nr:AFG1 family ATPase [Betaproteobacteria bacterium]
MTESSGPLQWYRTFSERPDFEPDAEQLRVIERLQVLHDELMAFKRYRQTLLARTFGSRPPPRGIYLHGAVGRGKSAMMDGFFSTLPYRRKRRVHFHEFMAGVHERMRQIHDQEDPLKRVAAEIAVQTRVLCFDEFHVGDIADAMILQRLFENMINWGVVLVITSNYAPDELYPDGLQRDRFLPAIELLKERLDVVAVNGDLDHRMREQGGHLETYFQPLGPASASAMQEAFRAFSPKPERVADVELMQRRVPVLGVGPGVVWFDFDILCGSARSQRDYLELAGRYYVVLLSNVPVLTPRQADAARRLTWLVDILYDRHIKLLVSAAAAPEALYPEGMNSNEFQRTVSRLQEMQTPAYQAQLSMQ